MFGKRRPIEITARNARKLLVDYLSKEGLPSTRVQARTISFMDLARFKRVFVKVYGWFPSPDWEKVREFAVANGFSVETG